ncbi:MAG: glycosyltransferase family 4 protein [Anaerolineales bacterium]
MNIKQSKLHLLIHHHHIVYQDKDDVIWLSANIGRWVDAIASYVGEIGLLFYQSEDKTPQQDTPITKSNVRLHSLGPRKTIWQRLLQLNQLSEICAEAGESADGLLIRGITPHQYAIWRQTPVAYKAFFLVGNLEGNRQPFPRSFGELVDIIARYYRLKGLLRIAKSDTLMLVNSPLVVSEIEQTFNKRAYFVPTNSILESEFPPPQVRPIKTPLKLLYCGRLDLKKGLRELLHAIAILNKQGNSCQLDIVGTKSEPVYSQLVASVQKLDITGLIRWHGFVPYGENLFTFYRDADVFILPSYTEGFPHVIWEAAANCCPVITTCVGGIPTLIEHEKHALLIPPKDVNAIVIAIKQLLIDDNLRSQLVINAYHYAKTFAVETCARRLANTLAREWN